MAINTTSARMKQLHGKYAELDKTQMLQGEIAVPSDHGPVVCKQAGTKFAELLTKEDEDYFERLIEQQREYLNELEEMIHGRIGINDDVTSTTSTYSSSKIEDKFNEFNSSLDWKESVDTFTDLLIAYPDAQDGWTCNVKDDDMTYRFDGENWVNIAANAIPMASATVDGKMSKEQYAYIDSIDDNVKKNNGDLNITSDEGKEVYINGIPSTDLGGAKIVKFNSKAEWIAQKEAGLLKNDTFYTYPDEYTIEAGDIGYKNTNVESELNNINQNLSKIGFIEVDVSGVIIGLQEEGYYYSNWIDLTDKIPQNSRIVSANPFGSFSAGISCVISTKSIALQCPYQITLPASRIISVCYM